MISWSTRDIDVFLALAETLSFRRAAERVHLSQPAVTAVINRLEDGLQVRLFDRTTRQVQLTQPGQVFVEQAQRLRHMHHEAVRRVQEVAQLEVGQVAMAAMPSLLLKVPALVLWMVSTTLTANMSATAAKICTMSCKAPLPVRSPVKCSQISAANMY